MNWNQLEYIIAIKEEKNISKAAELLFITQPSLSLSLKSLEQELGTNLFERRKGELILTYAGKLFYDWALTTRKSYQQMTEKVGEIAQQKRQLIRVGISPHRSQLLMPLVLERFYRECPSCEVILTEKPTYEMRKLLETDEMDLIIDTPHSDSIDFYSELIAEEQIILAIPDSFSIPEIMETDVGKAENVQSDEAKTTDAETAETGILSVELGSLTGFPFILQSGDQVIGKVSRRICERENFSPDIRLTCESLNNALMLCRQQLGVAFVPEIFASLPEWSKHIRFFRINGEEAVRQICMVYSKKRREMPALEIMKQIFRETAAEVYGKCE